MVNKRNWMGHFETWQLRNFSKFNSSTGIWQIMMLIFFPPFKTRVEKCIKKMSATAVHSNGKKGGQRVITKMHYLSRKSINYQWVPVFGILKELPNKWILSYRSGSYFYNKDIKYKTCKLHLLYYYFHINDFLNRLRIDRFGSVKERLLFNIEGF